MKTTSIRILLSLLAVTSVPAAIAACSVDSEDVDDAEGAAKKKKTPKGATVKLYDDLDTALPDGEAGASTPSPLKVDLVVEAMKKTRDTFYPATITYNQGNYSYSPTGVPKYTYPASSPNSASTYDQAYMSEPESCLSACPPYYSDLVCQFYCRHPSYQTVSPNVRGCFSSLARGTKVPDNTGAQINLATYSQMYAYCLYAQTPGDTSAASDAGADTGADGGAGGGGAVNGFDVVLFGSKPPIWDEQIMLANKQAKRKLGVVKWVDDNEGEAFRHVMYTWYNPFAFSMEQQQEALNKFFGVTLQKKDYAATDTADVNECRSKRPPASYDPQDGTHCSASKVLASARGMHPNAATIIAKMRELHIEKNPTR